MTHDYYELLGVPEDASNDQIRRAFRRKGAQCHPDRLGPGASDEMRVDLERQFAELSNAHDVLTDESRRRKYDQQRRFGTAGGAGVPGGFAQAGGMSEADIREIYERFFFNANGFGGGNVFTFTTMPGGFAGVFSGGRRDTAAAAPVPVDRARVLKVIFLFIAFRIIMFMLSYHPQTFSLTPADGWSEPHAASLNGESFTFYTRESAFDGRKGPALRARVEREAVQAAADQFTQMCSEQQNRFYYFKNMYNRTRDSNRRMNLAARALATTPLDVCRYVLAPKELQHLRRTYDDFAEKAKIEYNGKI